MRQSRRLRALVGKSVRRKEMLAEHFGVEFDEPDWEPRYNIAPSQWFQ
jgi:hypothetical protein